MDFIPSRNSVLVPYLVAQAAVISADFADYGITSPQAVAHQALVDNVSAAWDLITDPATRTSVAIEDFNTKKSDAIASARQLNQIAQLSSADSAQLVAAGFPVRDTTRSPQQPVTASVELILNSAIPEVVRVTARNPETPTSKAKPANTGAVQVAMAIGTVAAVSPEQATENRYYSRSPFNILTTTEQRGKVMTVFARYQSKGTIGGVKVYGPWSAPLVVSLP